MANAVLDGRPFRIDPHSIAWDFQVNTVEHQTIGGKVIQIFGAKMGDLVIEGAFGIGGWEEQLRFLARIRDLGQRQLDLYPNTSEEPFRFVWPSRGWDFKVWVRAYDNPEGGGSVEHSNEAFNPKWRLTLFIVEDNIDLKKASTNAYIKRLFAGIGWKQTEFNGPMTFESVSAILTERGVDDARDYLSTAYGAVPSNVSAGATEGGATAPDAAADTEIKAYAQQKAGTYGWTGNEWNALAAIVMKESGWNPHADNPSSTAYGIFQFLDGTWAGVGGTKTSNYRLQIDYGLIYIKNRYGTPSKALAFHEKNGWY